MIFQDITIEYKNQVNHDPYSRETQFFQKRLQSGLEEQPGGLFSPCFNSHLSCVCLARFFWEQVATSCFYWFRSTHGLGEFLGHFCCFSATHHSLNTFKLRLPPRLLVDLPILPWLLRVAEVIFWHNQMGQEKKRPKNLHTFPWHSCWWLKSG